MDELIVRRLRGEATDIEARQLDRWRAESPENEREYGAFIDLWSRTSEPGTLPVGPTPGLGEILREGDARRTRARTQAARRAFLRSPWVASGLTAAVAAALILLAYPWAAERGSSTQGLFPVESSSTPADITTLGLSDGSVVRMMSETRVEFPPGAGRREVVLDGQAFFAVAADPMPFVVRTRWGEVTAEGTRFEILSDRSRLRVVVVEGRVRLEGASGSAELGAGQVAYVGRDASLRVVEHDDVWSMLEWADGLLVYEATPLSMVAEELSRNFGRDVTIADEGLEGLRITAWFADEPFEEVVSAVCLLAGVPCEVDGSGATIGSQDGG